MRGGPDARPSCPFQFRDRRLRLLWDHWTASLRPEALPRREDIDPSALREILDITWIYRLDDSGRDFYCALAGELIIGAWRRPNMIGSPISLLFAPDVYKALKERWLDLLDRPAVMHGSMLYNPTSLELATDQAAERLNLPLSGADGRPYGMIGVTAYARRRADVPEPNRLRLLPPRIVPVSDLFLIAPQKPTP